MAGELQVGGGVAQGSMSHLPLSRKDGELAGDKLVLMILMHIESL